MGVTGCVCVFMSNRRAPRGRVAERAEGEKESYKNLKKKKKQKGGENRGTNQRWAPWAHHLIPKNHFKRKSIPKLSKNTKIPFLYSKTWDGLLHMPKWFDFLNPMTILSTSKHGFVEKLEGKYFRDMI